MMELYTERLVLRPWKLADAEDLYDLARDARVGLAAGWLPHTDVENSRWVLENILMRENIYAICLKDNPHPIGCISLMTGGDSNLKVADDEGEIGYWIGVPYWGNGLVPEACREIIRYSFEALGLSRLWCGYFEGNEKSRRVQEKCGFVAHHTNHDILWSATNEIKTVHVALLEKSQWKKERFL